MNNEMFRAEIHKYIDERYNAFAECQQLVREILDEFHRVCEKNDIPYCVSFGSLIGLIRDGGSIPWDYDIDVVIPHSYLEKLIVSLERDLGEEFFYVYSNNMSDYPTCCLRVCRKGYTYMAFHVDVFFLIGCPKNPKENRKFKKQIKWLYYARKAKYLQRHLHPDRKQSVIRKVITALRYPVSGEKLFRMENGLSKKYALSESAHCTIFYPFDKEYTRESFDSIQKISVGDAEYNIPAGFDLFLKEQYGNYEEYLPVSQRFDEFYKMGGLIEERQNVYGKYLKKNVE